MVRAQLLLYGSRGGLYGEKGGGCVMAVREKKRPRATLFTHGGLRAEGVSREGSPWVFFFLFSHTRSGCFLISPSRSARDEAYNVTIDLGPGRFVLSLTPESLYYCGVLAQSFFFSWLVSLGVA